MDLRASVARKTMVEQILQRDVRYLCWVSRIPFEYEGNIYHSCTDHGSSIFISSEESLHWFEVNKIEFAKER